MQTPDGLKWVLHLNRYSQSNAFPLDPKQDWVLAIWATFSFILIFIPSYEGTKWQKLPGVRADPNCKHAM